MGERVSIRENKLAGLLLFIRDSGAGTCRNLPLRGALRGIHTWLSRVKMPHPRPSCLEAQFRADLGMGVLPD